MQRNEETGTEVVVPHLAESLVSAVVGKWLKAPGDEVREYEVLCELITDKVTVQMPSPMEGVLLRILVQEGEEAAVGAPLCLVREPAAAIEMEGGEKVRVAKSAAAAWGELVGDVGAAGMANEGEVAVERAAERAAERSPPARAERQAATGHGGSWLSPAVQRLARELRVELARVRGTGLDGRITRKDVLAYAAARPLPPLPPLPPPRAEPAPERAAAVPPAAPPLRGSAPAAAAQPGASPAADGATGDEAIAVTPIRRMIAARMHRSVTEIPHAWMAVEADVTPLVKLRQRLKDGFLSREGVKLTYVPFVLKAAVAALKDFPQLNASWTDDGVTVHKDIHVCIAIGSETSVVTPVLRHADRKTIAGLAFELDDLTKRARAGTLTLADMQGGTITFNNTGAFGSLLSYPILNPPQAAILTFESIVKRPVVLHEDCIAVRSMANLCLSWDYRVLDEAVCGRFLQRVKGNLEQLDPEMSVY